MLLKKVLLLFTFITLFLFSNLSNADLTPFFTENEQEKLMLTQEEWAFELSQHQKILVLKQDTQPYCAGESIRTEAETSQGPIVSIVDPELEGELPEFAMADSCRAKRTGAMITSYDDPHICNIYPFPDCLDHYCIPMIVGGHVIGVVQFLFRKSLSEKEKKNTFARVAEAQNFIAETLPVLESKHLAAEMEEMATKDQLTGLFNRRYLETSLDQMVAGIKRRGTTMGILMCDLDFFKQVNDSFGHDAGDAVLSQLSTLLTNSVRSADLVIRFGGEEFLIFLIDCEPGQSLTIAENIRKRVEDYKFQALGQTIQKTTSIGISEFPLTENQGIWEAIKFADVALYKAKDTGRNRVEVFEQSMWKENAC
jgi:diguanylate cyclase (GGDEF)-like protein